MPNIAITEKCNLRCPYCFAEESIGGGSTDISSVDYSKALDFLTKEGPVTVGLIGGEPLLHESFDAIVEKTVLNPHVSRCVVYTNGIGIEQHVEALSMPKVSLLVNWNSPEQLGEERFKAIERGMDSLVLDKGIHDRVNIGLNLYSDDFDYSYAKDLLQKYDLHRVRISLTIPSCKARMLETFKRRKPYLFSFFCRNEGYRRFAVLRL